MKTTTAQDARNAARDNSGRYIKNPCNCCGKGAPMDYFSDARCNGNGGFGLVLRSRCADRLAKLTDEQYAAEAKAKGF